MYLNNYYYIKYFKLTENNIIKNNNFYLYKNKKWEESSIVLIQFSKAK